MIFQFNSYMIPRFIVFSCMPHIISACIPVLSKSSEKQDSEEELDQKTFYNLGFHTDSDYPHLFKKMQSPLFKKAFEKGRKTKKTIS